MSRTDAHDPYWVKRQSPEWRRFFVEHHEHTDHICNFSVKNVSWKDCGLADRNIGKNIHCGCNMCTGQYSRRQDRRGQRHLARKVLRSGKWEDGIPKYTGARW